MFSLLLKDLISDLYEQVYIVHTGCLHLFETILVLKLYEYAK